MKVVTLHLLLWSQCIVSAQATIRFLTSQLLFQGIEEGRFDVIGDVRSAEDYAIGHIPNVTHLELLHLAGTPNQKATPEDLAGCEFCHIVLYSSDGNHAQDALRLLEAAGFQNLYNGLGAEQWALAGYPLVTRSDNVVPPCTINQAVSDACEAKHLANNPPVRAPTPAAAPVRPPTPVAPPVRVPTPVAAPVRPPTPVAPPVRAPTPAAAPVTTPVRPPSPALSPTVPVRKQLPQDPMKDAMKLSAVTDIGRGSLNRRRIRGDAEE